jgi:DNA-binding transcriptional ArsR family regulator
MSESEEETYSIMFSSLRHPARRKILRMLSERTMTFSQMLEELAIPSSHLTYHLENLGELVTKIEDGKYRLSSFGKASVAMMRNAEEVPDIHAKRFSALPLRWKSLYAVFVAAILVLASISFIQYSSFNQLSSDYGTLKADVDTLKAENEQLLSWSTSAGKAVTIIRDVIQLDTSKYQASLLDSTAEARSDLGDVIEEIFKYSFVNSYSKFEVTLRFRNGHFSLFQLSQLEGFPNYPPIYTHPQPTDALQASRELLERYKAASNEPYLSEMTNLLESTNGTDIEQTLGNTKLKASNYGDHAEIFLQYTVNGIDFSAKSVHIMFENSVIQEFSDDWSFYAIGNAEVNFSKEQAIEIARSAVKSFTWNASGVQISTFNVLDEPVSAVFFPHPRTEPLTLIPYWYVTLYLDRTYPSGVNVITVGVWADTGKIANIQALSEQANP